MSQLKLILSRTYPVVNQTVSRQRLLDSRSPWSSKCRWISSSCAWFSDKYKSDPDIKNFMRDIQDDFKKKGIIKKEDDTQQVDNKEEISSKPEDKAKDLENLLADLYAEDEKPTPKSQKLSESPDATKRKDLENLLSELYSEEGGGGGKGEDISSAEKEKGNVLSGYSSFKDEDAPIIYDFDEERQLILQQQEFLVEEKKQKFSPKYNEISTRRGLDGVFDLQDLVKVVKDEKLKDLAVIRIPKERKYADYFVIGTGRNSRHIHVISQLIRKLYKSRALPSDPNLSSEGVKDKGQSGWIAMDLGNIVLHLFTQSQRDYYSLETLWTLGPGYDEIAVAKQQEVDPLTALMSSHIPPEFDVVDEVAEKSINAEDFKEAEIIDIKDDFATEDVKEEVLALENADDGQKIDTSFSNTANENTNTSRGGRTLA
eukprot:TRINITY_DN4028_c0_g1_i16.p1 TRINITY_DN4028_c0_g1~~TRINITY_DN4028_c0_g1_i16.p1  ORF type:complete len:428 (-),score=101.09 TRINITY_DN4028_c0_g1_i16:578-1861(-)